MTESDNQSEKPKTAQHKNLAAKLLIATLAIFLIFLLFTAGQIAFNDEGAKPKIEAGPGHAETEILPEVNKEGAETQKGSDKEVELIAPKNDEQTELVLSLYNLEYSLRNNSLDNSALRKVATLAKDAKLKENIENIEKVQNALKSDEIISAEFSKLIRPLVIKEKRQSSVGKVTSFFTNFVYVVSKEETLETIEGKLYTINSRINNHLYDEAVADIDSLPEFAKEDVKGVRSDLEAKALVNKSLRNIHDIINSKTGK